MAASQIVTARLDDVVLARVAFGSRVSSSSALATELEALAPATYDAARWSGAIDEAMQRLAGIGRMHDKTVDEREADALLPRLGLAIRKPWRAIRATALPRLAFGLPPRDLHVLDKLDKRELWAAAIVARALGLWTHGKPPGVSAVCDAVVWRALELPGKAKRTPPEVRAHFLVNLLAGGSGAPERLLALLAAREIGAPRADLVALRDALVRRWLCGSTWANDAPAIDTVAIDTVAIDAFASAVRESADRATEGVFGGRKVFISSLWHGMRAQPPVSGMTLDEFKSQLVRAHRAGLVELTRADLTGAMDPHVVRDSETAHLEARYHFVERGASS